MLLLEKNQKLLTTNESRTTYQKEDKLDFKNPIDEAIKILPELKEKSDLIFAVTHMGHEPESRKAQDDIKLAQLTEGIDVIVGGHSQKLLPRPHQVKDSYIVQAHEWGKYVGKLDLNYKNGKIKMTNYQLVPVNLKTKVYDDEGNESYVVAHNHGEEKTFYNKQGETITVKVSEEIKRDQSMLDFLKPFQDRGSDLLDIRIGESTSDFSGERSVVRKQQAPLGQLFNEAYLAKVSADISLMNGGGIRDSVPAGEITYKTVLKIAPFGNTISGANLTAAQLKDLMKKVRANENEVHLTGIELDIQGEEVVGIRVKGKELEEGRTYKVITNNYFAETLGLDRLESYSDSGYVDADVLRSYIESKESISASDYSVEGIINLL